MVKKLEKVYHILNPFLQNIALSFYGYYWHKRRMGGEFDEHLQECKRREMFSTSQWEEFNNNKFKSILIHAFKTVPFYRKLYSEHGLDETILSEFSLNDINKLPIIDKKILRQFGQNEMLSEVYDKVGSFFPSSGSSGTPTQTWYSKKMHQEYYAIYESRVNAWAGVNRFIPRGTFGPRRIVMDPNSKGPFYRHNYVEKQTYFSAFHISSKNINDYLNGLRKYNVKYLTGYCMSNYFMARFIEEEGLKAPNLKAVLTSSEKLTDEMRETFRRVFGCETFDAYNGVEACNLISECEFHKLHIVPDVGYTEIINDKGLQCLPGETGQVVATGFLNFDQPLIRYRMGDLVTLSKSQECQCGRNMPIVEEIVGRVMDTVITHDGREMVSFYRVFSNNTSIVESQVIQHNLNDFEIKLVLSKPLPISEKFELLDKLKSQLGDQSNVEINIVDTIPRGPNGKFKSVISHVKRNR